MGFRAVFLIGHEDLLLRHILQQLVLPTKKVAQKVEQVELVSGLSGGQ